MIQDEYKKKIDKFDAQYQKSDLRCNADEVDPNAPPLSDQADVITFRANFCK